MDIELSHLAFFGAEFVRHVEHALVVAAPVRCAVVEWKTGVTLCRRPAILRIK